MTNIIRDKDIIDLAITTLAFSVKGLCGFGDGLIFSTFMSFVSQYTAITPVATIMSFPSNAIITWKERNMGFLCIKKVHFLPCH